MFEVNQTFQNSQKNKTNIKAARCHGTTNFYGVIHKFF